MQKDRRRSSQNAAMLVVGVISLAVHATIFATASVGVDLTRGGSDRALTTAPVVHEMEFSCWSDAGLALSARQLGCTVPGLGDPTCAAQAWQDFRFDWLLCDGLEDAPAAETLALLSPEDIAKLEPMPLLDVPAKDELELATLLEQEVEEKAEAAEQSSSNPRETGQVIEVTAPAFEATPDNARFLSEYDTHAEKEMVARGSTEAMVAKPSPKEMPIADTASELTDKAEPAGESNSEQLAEAKVEAKEGEGDQAMESALLAMREMQFRSRSEAGELTGVDALAANGLAAKKGDGAQDSAGQKAQEGQDAVGGQSASRSAIPNLRPSEDTLSRVVGGGSVDKLDGVETGDFTALNSKKWKFASFFNRMKRQVAQNWHPDVVYARRDPTGKVYGTKDRVTVLEVSLQPGGKLAKVIVIEESGVDFLDNEAVAAFERAQPFPNPPSGLIASSSGLITFSFGFHFQVGAPRGGWKIFRQQ